MVLANCLAGTFFANRMSSSWYVLFQVSGEAEVGPDKHAEAGAAPDETGVALEVPGLRVHHELLQGAADEAGNVGAVAGEADGLLAKSGRSLDWS